jgi:hypothetical protein
MTLRLTKQKGPRRFLSAASAMMLSAFRHKKFAASLTKKRKAKLKRISALGQRRHQPDRTAK